MNKAEKIEKMGFDIGMKAIDKMLYHKTDKVASERKIIHMLCLEFWPYLFWRPIKNYATNNKGLYIIEDNNCLILWKLTDVGIDSWGEE